MEDISALEIQHLLNTLFQEADPGGLLVDWVLVSHHVKYGEDGKKQTAYRLVTSEDDDLEVHRVLGLLDYAAHMVKSDDVGFS
jgi:hypothetical protein